MVIKTFVIHLLQLNRLKGLLLTLLAALSLPTAVIADDQGFENWKESYFENYPFECVEDGATPEYTRCAMEDLLKSDWELKKELVTFLQ